MKRIHSAVRLGDADALRACLAAGIAVDRPEADTGLTPLMIACDSPGAGIEILRLLIAAGANVNARSPKDYTAFFYAAHRDRPDFMEALLEAGASPDAVTSYGESAIRSFSWKGKFERVGWLLKRGADPAPLGWTPLHRAIALGRTRDVAALIAAGAPLEKKDSWERTAFLLAIQTGDCAKTALLLERGADREARGRCGRTPLSYPSQTDDTVMLRWLLDQGFDPDSTDDHGDSALDEAIDFKAPDCCRILLGVSWRNRSLQDRLDGYNDLISETGSPLIAQALLEHGADPSQMDKPLLHQLIGLRTVGTLPVSKSEYQSGRFRRFGKANPERARVPFWEAMVRCGCNAYNAATQFDDSSFGRRNPVWCHDRFGMSLTALPDGRFIQIAGEHEDGYDPDFCIYNDVFIHDGHGNFEILIYPEDIFPPTDFHSATLIGKWIYIIGNLGYPEGRGTETPVYRLNTENGVIQKVAARGQSPGWIHKHHAILQENGLIHISGGRIHLLKADGSVSIEKHSGEFLFDPKKAAWTRIAAPQG